MNTKTIKVAYVNEPKSPKGPGNIKTDDGTYYKVWRSTKKGNATLAAFVPGGTYEVEFETGEYNGKPQYEIVNVKSTSISQTTNGNGNGHGNNGTTPDRSDAIRWQTCLKVSGDIHSGNAVPASTVIAFARELYAATPDGETTVEDVKQVFNATEVPEGETNW